jgi:isopentenyl diphosphate isomerase/L-lactate dehydrogenase-like FMN-dependent dehydrogenase
MKFGVFDHVDDSGVSFRHHASSGHTHPEALSIGARAVGIGRYYLFPLAVGGEEGVELALELVRAEIERGMKLMGCAKISQLSRANLRIR